MYRFFKGLHPVYMPQRTSRNKQDLPWRVTRMREWRESRDLTLEQVVEALALLPEPIETTYPSLGRIERGLQRPGINMIEAIAALYKTDVHSLLNRHPTDPEMPRRPGEADDLLAIWRKAKPNERRIIVDLAKTVTKSRE